MIDVEMSDRNSSTTPTETTTKRLGSPDPPPEPEKPGHQVASRENEAPTPKATRPRQTYDDIIRVLVLGRSGSGKTYIIQTLGHAAGQPLTEGLFEPTKDPCSAYVSLGERMIELIDTPGFDNINLSDVEAFTKVANYLREPQRIKTGITGIIYVHRAGDAINSRSLSRNLQVLTDIFLQKVGTSRLVVLEAQLWVQRVAHTSFRDELRSQRSAFGQVWPLGARLSHFHSQRGFTDLLQDFASQAPIILPIQSEASNSNFAARIERILGLYEQESLQAILRGREDELREKYDARLARLVESESQLREQLKEAELGYSSLRSQLQLQENVEQSEVVQALNDVNRMIEDIGRTISEHLIDTHLASAPGKDHSKMTALDAADVPALKALLGHKDGKCSMVVSSSGQGMQIESFFDFAIRHILCRHLDKEIFRPFHPGVRSSLNRIMNATRDNIRKQAPQVIAGKWRSDTFKNIYEDDQDTRKGHIHFHLEKLMGDRLKPLAKYVLGKDITFTEDHRNRILHLLEAAWDWNSKLKGDVIMLGDFIQTSFPPRCLFHSKEMEEFERNPHNPEPVSILGTLALGLSTQRAAGGGNSVVETVVSKATVLTNNVFI